jgi:hypothetical protein
MTNPTAIELINMANNGQRQKALFKLRNIKKHHGIEHYNKLLADIRVIKENEDQAKTKRRV